MSKVDVVEILKKSDALLEGHFLLSSGKHSNRYVQCAKVLRYPEYAAQVLSTVVDQIKDLDIDLVVGPAMGGVIVSYELGRQLNKEAVFTERKDGVMQLRRGFEVKPGAKIIISEDVVTTGKSTLETKKALEELGGEVIGVACIADRTSAPIGMPIYSAIKLDIQVHEADDCPLCKEGKIELVRVFFILFSNLAVSGNTYIKINARTTLTIVNINLNIILIVLSDIKLHK
mgnify:CR=1 FL=1